MSKIYANIYEKFGDLRMFYSMIVVYRKSGLHQQVRVFFSCSFLADGIISSW